MTQTGLLPPARSQRLPATMCNLLPQTLTHGADPQAKEPGWLRWGCTLSAGQASQDPHSPEVAQLPSVLSAKADAKERRGHSVPQTACR
jgi:hypothetical protein